MATTEEIAWNDGSGDKIYVTSNAFEGDQTVLVSSDANTGAARSKVVTFTSGVGGIVRTLTVNQDAGTPINLAGNVEDWYYKKGSSSSISQYDSRGYAVLRCGNASDVNNYNVWAADRATTLWSAVNGRTVKIRIKTSSIVDGIFTIGIYQNASITSLGNTYCRRAGLPNLVLADDGYYEQTFECNLANFTLGSLTPGANSTFGLNCYARSRVNYEQIFDVQIYIV